MQPAASPMEMEMTIWKTFMTMPTTAMGICAYCGWPKMGSAAPQRWIMLLMAAMAATREICDSRLQMPSGRNFAASLGRGAKQPLSRSTAFMRVRYHTARAAVSTWPMTVATAAPIMPQRKTKMNMGSRMMLTAVPASVDAMAKRGLPSERMMGFMAWPNM